MKHEQLINFLQKYGTISELEKKNIKNYFIPLQVKKKQILIEKNSPCNKLFFINKGFLRAYYSNDNGKEITRMIAWENRFLTNIGSFKGFTENNETIESLENGEILCISRDHFDILMKSSFTLKNIYADILEMYNALHIKRFEALNTFDLDKKMNHLKQEFPHLIHKLSDTLLASLLGISRETYVRNKKVIM